MLLLVLFGHGFPGCSRLGSCGGGLCCFAELLELTAFLELVVPAACPLPGECDGLG